ncbi:TPA: helix-turn-helix domain-containing protein [Clostridioides difficile]|uniref:helix-turn-helix domain-containing protein n=1 Tax=Clostridioides difficile TaxID=1496 RepID=UPI002FE61B62
MVLNKDIGAKIKQLRTQKQMTLKDMSEKTNLSIGFLSQLERGLTSVATDSLGKIASVLDVELTYFFMKPKEHKRAVLRSYEKEVFDVENSTFIHYHLSSSLKEKTMLPRLIEILPSKSSEEICCYVHEGEEFVYVLEGTLTVFLGDEQIEMYPGDTIHYNSEKNNHNWVNYTNKVVKILVVSIPNPFEKSDAVKEV